MGKLMGFLNYDRQLPPDREPIDRINDWEEIHEVLPLENQIEQAGRCMYCGVPFCHSGITIKGVPTGCPLGNLIPEWNDLLFRNEWDEAVDRLLRTNSFPEFTGRVCPALCEGACTCGIHQPTVTIKQNELMLIERAFESGHMTPQIPQKRTNKKVAVIGSGPAGLACANILNKYGHQVTVFEREDRIGGLLMYGIPNMKLDKSIVQRRIDLMKQEGISFITGVHVGVDKSAQELQSEFDAIILCCGSTAARDLKVAGREGKGVIFAVDYLTSSTKKLLDSAYKQDEGMNAKDKHVIIIGGGDTGTDCVGTALRQGCKSVHQFEIMPKPSLERTQSNPWPEYPKVLKTDYAQQEAIAKYGDDPRQYLISTREIERDENGKITAVITDNIQWKKAENGRMQLETIQGTEKRWPADIVLIAMGFVGPENTLVDAFALPRDARTNVIGENYKTERKGVFVAGDMHSGQSLVVRAICEGQQAATSCDEYLKTLK